LAKTLHEIRDPIHTFIRVDDHDRRVMDSGPVQRLRQVHQLAMSYLVYPGATHRRFEHSLGVMDLAGAVFDVVTRPENVDTKVADVVPNEPDERAYWRRALRMAALCHDIGHLPFSHAQESLLPDKWDHERMTVALVTGPQLSQIFSEDRPPLNAKDVARLAAKSKAFLAQFEQDSPPSVWQSLLGEIISGDAFGVDRMDYLLRDSLHAGVAYGRFDHHRLIDNLRILRMPEGSHSSPGEPQLGVTEGGLQSAEALLLARYFMFTQVYLHPVRRIYDLHLGEFLQEWLKDGVFSTDLDGYLATSDVEVLAALREAARNGDHPGHEPAVRITNRRHFKVLWHRTRTDVTQNQAIGDVIFEAAVAEFGAATVRRPNPRGPGEAVIDFPVQLSGGRVTSAQLLSDVLRQLPPVASDVIYVEPTLRDQARKWLDKNLQDFLGQVPKEES
jgi:HD superfamily phosphohydrolase